MSQEIITKSGKMTKPKSKKLKLGLTIAVVSILVVGGGYFAYDQFAKPKDSGKRNAIAVKRADVDLAVLATGTIRPEQDVKISPKQTGLLKSLLVKQGDRVKKAKLSPRWMTAI
ncbi:MAG: efflux RND transporter periplasmic adaptor subunit [Candidatus Melainabacteria bacterium]|nr:MAG: efflux RND transporter periplasmic adaptor subunit [Candidatus Melainabacteria bacterium]